MQVRAYRLELDGGFWILLVDPQKFDAVPAAQREHKWNVVGNIELGPSSSTTAIDASGDLKELGYVVVRGSTDAPTIN